MDEALQGLVEAAESGIDRPRIRLMTSAAFIEGKVVSDLEAQALQQASLAAALGAKRNEGA